MSEERVAINKLLLLLELAEALDFHPSLLKITDENGHMVIPKERLDDFNHDFRLIIDRILEKLCEPYEET